MIKPEPQHPPTPPHAENGTRVLMRLNHPHHGKTGIVREQPATTGSVAGAYLIEFDMPYEGNAYAWPGDFRVIDGD